MKLIVSLFLFMLAATVNSEIFSLSYDYQISTQISSQELAHIYFEQLDRQTGWNRLYIYTNPDASPRQQHRAAGFLEGYATYSQIYSAFTNFIFLDFDGKSQAPPNVQTFMDNQLEYMDAMIKSHSEDIFWQYASYYLDQVRYMHAGYQTRIKREKLSEKQLTFSQFYYLTSIGDLQDLLPLGSDPNLSKNCNAYVRLLNNQLYTTHGTHNRYPFLLRIYKHWNFPRQGVPMQSTSFTSRPGDLISKDDFILLSSGLRVLQTSFQNQNQSNLNELKSSTAPSWIRTLIANHLSHTSEQWITYFLRERSGTHNNQWMLIDANKLKSKEKVVMFFQQAFSMYRIVDMTDEFFQREYVASYNMPFTQQIANKLGVKKGDYRSDIRAQIFNQYHPKMVSLEDMKFWLIQNQVKFNQGFAPRYDLLPSNPKAFGMTDCKVASQQTIKNNYFWAISGPPTSNGRFPPFDWSNWPNVRHDGLQPVYNFTWQKIPIDMQRHLLLSQAE